MAIAEKLNLSLLIGTATFFLLSVNIGNAQVQLTVYPNGSRPLTAGICTVEVPTTDLLSEEDRRGVIPRSNGTRPGYSKIQICCSGWKRQRHSAYYCEPECHNDCPNGNCTAPGQCVCLPGYVKDLDNNCVPTCPRGCLHGLCTLRNTCDCDSGHIIDPTGKFCVPNCVGGCGVGGNCTAPGVCSCKPGFEKNPSTGKCGYHCAGGCPGGECVGPNLCSCASGYVRRNNLCEPLCPGGCVNGDCTGPNQCTCKPGFTFERSRNACIPAPAHCSEPCLNGDCTGPNMCTCKNGYVKDPSVPTSNRCVAHCPGGCPNGQCSAPNFCICNPGFIKAVRGSNNCVPRTR